MNCLKTTNNDIVIMKDAKYLTNASRKNKNNKIWGKITNSRLQSSIWDRELKGNAVLFF